MTYHEHVGVCFITKISCQYFFSHSSERLGENPFNACLLSCPMCVISHRCPHLRDIATDVPVFPTGNNFLNYYSI